MQISQDLFYKNTDDNSNLLLYNSGPTFSSSVYIPYYFTGKQMFPTHFHFVTKYFLIVENNLPNESHYLTTLSNR